MKTDWLVVAWLLSKGLVMGVQIALLSLFVSHAVIVPLWEAITVIISDCFAN
jgi:hypothetical protein